MISGVKRFMSVLIDKNVPNKKKNKENKSPTTDASLMLSGTYLIKSSFFIFSYNIINFIYINLFIKETGYLNKGLRPEFYIFQIEKTFEHLLKTDLINHREIAPNIV